MKYILSTLLLLVGFWATNSEVKAQSLRAGFYAVPVQGCDSITVAFQDTSSGAPSEWLWDIDNDGTIDYTDQNPTHTYKTPGQYTVRLIVKKDDQTDTITSTDLIRVNASFKLITNVKDSTVCAGSAVTLVVSGASRYLWFPSIDLSSDIEDTVIARPMATRTYSVIGFSGACRDTAVIKLEYLDLPGFRASIDSATICLGDSIIITAANAKNYEWNPTTNLIQFKPDSVIAFPKQTQTYVVSSKEGICTFRRFVKINVIDNIPIRGTQSARDVCEKDTVFFVLSGANTYQWIDSEVNPITTKGDTAYIIAARSKIYTVVGAVGSCERAYQFSVSVTPLPILTYTTASASICEGERTTYKARGAERYTWKPTSSIQIARSDSAVLRPKQTTTYTLVGVNGRVCSDSITFEVIVKPLPKVRITTNDSILCQGEETLLEANGASSYLWHTADRPTTNTITVKPEFTTTYTLTGIQDGCSNTARITVSVLTFPVVRLASNGKTEFCPGESVELIATSMPMSKYEWFRDGSIILTENNKSTYSATVAGSYKVRISPLNCNNSKETDAVTVVALNVPTPQASGGRTICLGKTVRLSVTGGERYKWAPSESLNYDNVPLVEAKPTKTTTYTVTVSNANTCTVQTTITVTVLPDTAHTKPILNYQDVLKKCDGEAVELSTTVSDGLTLQWLRNGNTIPGETNSKITINQEGSYSLRVSSDYCQSATSDVVTLEYIPLPKAYFEVRPATDPFTDDGWLIITPYDGIKPYLIAIDDQEFSPIRTFYNLRPKLYTVQVKDQTQCISKTEVEIPALNTSRKDLASAEELFDIYPNPSSGRIFLKSKKQLNEKINFEIYNMSGQLVDQTLISATESYIEHQLAKGVYIIKLFTQRQFYYHKMIVE